MSLADRTSTSTISIRELTPDLVSPAATLLAQHIWPDSRPIEHQVKCGESLLRLLQWPSAQFFLAAQEGVYAGFASINWGFSTTKGQPILHVQDLFILPEYRRRRIAQALLQHLVQLGRQQDANRLQLETGTQNTPARTLYITYGFEWFPDKEIYMLFL
jgi:ribosomal protein S18 acetylase RimI-like enzyme